MSSCVEQLNCCGITELADICTDATPEHSLLVAGTYDQGLVVFSDVHTSQYKHGKALASLIKRLKLGKVVVSYTVTNPNTENRVRAWMWSVNQKALETWQDAHRNDPKLQPKPWRSIYA